MTQGNDPTVLFEVGGGGVGAALAVYGGGDYAACVTCALTAGEQAFKADVLEGFVIADYAYG